ncbi:helix-turn-helix transcriptional regulator [Gymnodinialimonas ceratoperidinii]|uniref:Helix-turn-helix domain-containing protein n=1 Tax=Gymnodinialimonas ceratoperidinii TaxID=2856823 RepID=A0A8F6TU63_9RHOB|nr:helix-turn-helix domain-containing protein [Gymnodinialimonas ceratoperidinii]QXT38745.1 helix-turn-helix domain-containing protein [Gymnodinialimonas ceratoperidinii]
MSEHHKIFLTKQEAAHFLRISVRTLTRRENEGMGPPRIKHGAKVVYRRQSLERWLEALERQPVRLRL